MGYRTVADGVTEKGKTKGKNLGDSGKEIGIESGKSSKGARSVTGEAMRKMGRNMARVMNQRGK
jgi:hypothetical protein